MTIKIRESYLMSLIELRELGDESNPSNIYVYFYPIQLSSIKKILKILDCSQYYLIPVKLTFLF